MIFNDKNDGAQEIRRLTGSYFANNDFSLIEMDVVQAEDALRQIISDAVFDEAEELYHNGTETDDDVKLLELIQRPVALLAALNFFRKNDVSHEDSGRKVKLASDDSDKIPWEWQLDRDDEMHLEAYYTAVEQLIRHLDKTKHPRWIESDVCQTAKSLLIRSGRQFNTYFPINNSERMYVLLVSFIKEVQLFTVAPAFGDGFKALLAEKAGQETDVHFAACKALALLTMSTAIRRMPLSLIPSGVIRGYSARNGARDSQPASLAEISTISQWMEADAKQWISKMKDLRDGPSQDDYSLIPNNNPANKYFRT